MTKKIFSKPQAVIGLILITIVIICAIFAPVIAPNPPDQIDPSLKYHEADPIILLERISSEDASFHALFTVRDIPLE